MGENGLDWLCYLAGSFQTATTIFFQISRIYIFNHFIKNPQTTIALTFLTHIISAIGGVHPSLLSVDLFPALYSSFFAGTVRNWSSHFHRTRLWTWWGSGKSPINRSGNTIRSPSIRRYNSTSQLILHYNRSKGHHRTPIFCRFFNQKTSSSFLRKPQKFERILIWILLRT